MDRTSRLGRVKRSGEVGFTLIELLVVIAIIGILEAVLRENLFTIRTQVNNYFSDKGRYPGDLQELVDDHYLRDLPYDPITGSRDTWVVDYADLGEDDISTEPGIADVHSGADGYALNGSSYADW